MNILVDNLTCPKSIEEICQTTGLPVRFIRDREPDLYKLRSEDYDVEVEKQKKKTDEAIESSTIHDIVITQDLELARALIDRVFSVIHPNGFVYNRKSIMLLSYEAFIEEQNRAAGERSVEKLKNRETDFDIAFQELLNGFVREV